MANRGFFRRLGLAEEVADPALPRVKQPGCCAASCSP
jgi:hypothetical protein